MEGGQMKGGKRTMKILVPFLLLAVTVLSGCVKQQYPDMLEPEAGKVLELSAGEIPAYVAAQQQSVVVLFYSEQYQQSRDMSVRIDYFAGQYGGHLQFIKSHWKRGNDPAQFGLKLLPTTILYQGGVEVDRIKGIPKDQDVLAKWNDDLELWILKTALALEGDEYSGEYSYRFNNSPTLNISSY